MIRSNLHTHSLYCDGKNTLSELAEKAVCEGFLSLGFSSHAYMDFDHSFCMKKEDEGKYFGEIEELKEKFDGKLEIYKGLEYDIFSDADTSKCDYIIGAVHYIKHGGNYLCVDESPEIAKKNIDEFFGGSSDKYAFAYFEELAAMAKMISFDIVAHFDLLTKFNEKVPLINTSSRAYKTAALDAVSEIMKTHEIFEINTGAIARSWRTTPYPDDFILKEICRLGGQIVISSDCHDKNMLTCSFSNAVRLAKNCGFKTCLQMRGGKFTECEL